MENEEVFRRAHKKEYHRRFLANNIREDGRLFEQSREFDISFDGSATARIGSTTAIASVKLEVTTPSSETPDAGYVFCNVDIPSAAAGEGQASRLDRTNVLSYHLQEIISLYFDTSSLCIEEGRAVWVVYVDVCFVSEDGNLFDCAVLASTAALIDCKVPAVDITEENEVFYNFMADKKQLSLKYIFIPFTINTMFEKYVLVDPNSDEEETSRSLTSFVFRFYVESNNGEEKGGEQEKEDPACCYIFKDGGQKLDSKLLQSIMSRTNTKYWEIVSSRYNAVKEKKKM